MEPRNPDRVLAFTLSDDVSIPHVTGVIAENEDKSFVLSGFGRSFRSEMDSDTQNRAARDLGSVVARHRMPVVAVIEGDTLGPSLDVALYCDLRYAVPGVRVGLQLLRRTDIRADVVERLSVVSGSSLAARMCLMDEEIIAGSPGSERLVLTFDGLPSEMVQRVVTRLSAMAPLALEALKSLVIASGIQPFSAGVAAEADFASLLIPTTDRAEGLHAFAESREPKFEGR